MILTKRGFTLLEVIIALMLSSFIVIALGRSLRHASTLFDRGMQQMAVRRKAGYALQQLERDLSAAHIPLLGEKVKDEKAKGKLQKKKKETNFFIAQSDEDNVYKVGEKKFEFFKSVNFITTNPLVEYQQQKPKLVRVAYALARQKIVRRPEIESYSLVRKETADLKNEKFERKELLRREKWLGISRHIISDNVKELFVEYIHLQPVVKNRNRSEKKVKPLFKWGQTKSTKNVLPSYAKVHLVLWNDTFTTEWRYTTIIPFLSIGKLEVKKQKKVQGKEEKKAQDKQQPQAGGKKK